VRSLLGAAPRIGRRVGLVRRPGRHRSEPPRGPGLPPGRDPEGLTRWQAEWAEWRLAALRPTEYHAVCSALSEACPHARPYLRRAIAAGHPAEAVLALAEKLAAHPPQWAVRWLRLIDDVPGTQVRCGVRIDQVDSTTCGSAVLLVLASEADPLLTLALTQPPSDPYGIRFGMRFDQRQRVIHRHSNRFWPGRLGTSPWGMVGWLRRHAAGVGPYRVRLVDDASPADLAATVLEVNHALDLADPVPLLVGAALPRHYALALRRDNDKWRVYEPGTGEVRVVPVAAVRERQLGQLLGFDGLQAVLLPRH
jgi:hypothetical protein